MDEASSAPLHRWLAFCRMLMLHHPRVGAHLYAMHVQKIEHMRPGWNALHPATGSDLPVQYTWIGEKGGKQTQTKPGVPEESIHDVHEDAIPHLETTLAWRRVQEMATIVVDQRESGFTPKRVAEVMEHIRAASNCPLRGEDSWVTERVARGVETMRRVAFGEGKILHAFTEPSRSVVRECLDFRVTMTQASNVLAAFLLQYARTPAPLDHTSLPARVLDSADYLIERTLALSRERMRMNLTSYHEATYLGMLYGNAALLMLKMMAKQLPEDSKVRRRLKRRGLYIDEVMGHELHPSLMHPIDLAPCGILEGLHAAILGIADPSGIYPGAADQGVGPVEFRTIWPKVQAHSARAEAVDIVATIDAENDPVPPKDSERLMMFLMALLLGEQRSKRR